MKQTPPERIELPGGYTLVHEIGNTYLCVFPELHGWFRFTATPSAVRAFAAAMNQANAPVTCPCGLTIKSVVNVVPVLHASSDGKSTSNQLASHADGADHPNMDYLNQQMALERNKEGDNESALYLDLAKDIGEQCWDHDGFDTCTAAQLISNRCNLKKDAD